MIMNMNFRHIFVLFFTLIVSVVFTDSRAQKAVLSLDSSSIKIGERVQLRLNVALPKTATIYWPAIADTLTSKIEVANKSKVDTNSTSRQEFVNYSQNLLITSFDTGFHFIPPFTVHYSYSGDTSRHQLLTDAVYLKVRTVEVDTTRAIRDIRGPISAPLTFSEIAPYLGAIAIVGLLIGLIWYYFWRKRMNKPLFPMLAKVVGPPWEIALQNLVLLEDKKLWQNGKIKEYYSELTDILRQYLFQQHGVEAMEMITSEILAAYDSAGLQPDGRAILSSILVQADYTKFAKAIPQRSENELSLTYAKQFIEVTKPVPVPSDTKNNAKSPLQTTDPELKA
jgi:hypothetical protein